MVCDSDRKDAGWRGMSVESVYLVCTETLVFLLIVGGLMSLIIEDWQNEYAGFVIFYYSNVLSATVVGCCAFGASIGYMHQAVLVTARGALIFNVVVFGSFLMTAWECGTEWSSSKTPEPHVMHPLLFKASFDDGTAATIAYLVIGISLCVILVILHVFMYQQLHGTFAELRSAAHVRLHECLSAVVDAMEDGGPDEEEPMGAPTARRIVRLFRQVKEEDRGVDSGTFLQLVQVCVRTFLLVLCVLYDMKACLEGTKNNGFLELIPSLVLISYLALADGVLHAYTSHPGARWRIVPLILSVLLGLAYFGFVVITVVFYIAARSSDLLSDTRRTFLNVVLVGLMILDAALHVGSVCLLLLPHRETAVVHDDSSHHSADDEHADAGNEPDAEEDPSSAGSSAEQEAKSTDEAAPKATALGSSVRVIRVQGLDGNDGTTTFKQVVENSTGSVIRGLLGKPKSGTTALDVLQANKKNK